MTLLDWDCTFDRCGDLSNMQGVECGSPEQYQLRPSQHPAFAWDALVMTGPDHPPWPQNGSVRCLFNGRYDGRQALPGDEGWFAFAIKIPSALNTGGTIGDVLLWELHSTSQVYNVPGCSVVPHAIWIKKPTENGGDLNQDALCYRIMAGDGEPDQNSYGWESSHPNIKLLQPIPYDVWISLTVQVRFSEDDTGRVNVTGQVSDTPTEDGFEPLYSYDGPTCQYISSLGIHDDPLYPEFGIYNNGESEVGYDTAVYHTGMRACPSYPDAVAALT